MYIALVIRGTQEMSKYEAELSQEVVEQVRRLGLYLRYTFDDTIVCRDDVISSTR